MLWKAHGFCSSLSINVQNSLHPHNKTYYAKIELETFDPSWNKSSLDLTSDTQFPFEAGDKFAIIIEHVVCPDCGNSMLPNSQHVWNCTNCKRVGL